MTIRRELLKVLNDSKSPVTENFIIDRLHNEHGYSEGSVRKVVKEVIHDGLVERRKRGPKAVPFKLTPLGEAIAHVASEVER
jgi:repressor of nif and glnA expression